MYVYAKSSEKLWETNYDYHLRTGQTTKILRFYQNKLGLVRSLGNNIKINNPNKYII